MKPQDREREGMTVGRLYVVATPIGNLQDLSPRAKEVLEQADLILAEDTRHTGGLLSHFGIGGPMLSYHKFNEAQRSGEILRRIVEEDLQVALVSDAGTPCISDPGGILVREARELGIEVIGVSGPSAAITALSVAGLSTESFAFYGFPPRESGKREDFFAGILACPIPTFVLYESPKRIVATAAELAARFPGARACYCCDLTKLYEKSIGGSVEETARLLAENPNAGRGEYVIVLEKPAAPPAQQEGEAPLSPEALLVEQMVKTGGSLKEAVAALAAEGLRKKELYQAGLRLKALFGAGE